MLVFLMAFVILAQAADEFSANIDAIKTKRGLVTNDGIEITNCNVPNEPQYVIFSVEFEYPKNECSGPMDIYYTYYEFASEEYITGESQCTITTRDNCDIKVDMLFGGKGNGTITKDEWIRFRGVCRENGKEFTYNLPIMIKHNDFNVENEMIARLSSAADVISDAEAALSACTCCGNKDYATKISNYKNRLDTLEKMLAKCSFQGLSNDIIVLEQEAGATEDSIATTICPPTQLPKENESVEEIVEKNINNVSEEIASTIKNNTNLNGKQEEEEGAGAQQQKGICPAGAILVALLVGLFAVAKKI